MNASEPGPAPGVVISDDCGRLPLNERRLHAVLSRILADHGVRRTLSLALVDDARIREIHRDFLGEDSPTDVISFPLDEPERGGVNGEADDPGEVFGEVVVSVETAIREAPRHGNEPEREAVLYAIHGTLHLVGFDDVDETSRTEMRRAEESYLEVYDEI